jgi:hypothetical protein
MPERPAPDPFSLALGRIEGRLDGIEKRLDGFDKRFEGIDTRFNAMATKAELRSWATVILLAIGALFAAVLRHA